MTRIVVGQGRTMIRWSPIKLKFTLGIGSLASMAILSELSQKAIPVWAAVGIVILPFAIFVFADPHDIPRSIARWLQVGASLWYLVVNSALAVMFVMAGLKVGWWFMFIFLLIGAVPCLIVIGRAIVPAPPDEESEQVEYTAASWSGSLGRIDFSEPVVYRPRMGEMFGLLLVSLAFVAGGVLMIYEGHGSGWFVAAFFGLCAIVFVVELLPNCAYLKVSASGIEVRGLWRSHRYKWSDIAYFYAGNIGGNNMVLIAFDPSYERGQTGRSVARALTGAEGCLPDTYGVTAEELAERLNQWKAHVEAQ